MTQTVSCINMEHVHIGMGKLELLIKNKGLIFSFQ